MEDIIKKFLKERFGGLVADELFELHYKNLGIKDMNALSTNEQIKMGQVLIEKIAGQFSNPRNLENLKTLYLLTFALNQAAKRIEAIVHEKCDILLDPLKDVNEVEIEDVAKAVIDEEKTHFFYTVMNGALVMTLDNEVALAFAKYIMVNMQDTQPDSDEIDEKKLSAIRDFFGTIFPVFSQIVGENQGRLIVFSAMKFDDFKKEYLSDEKFVAAKVTQTNILFKIDDERFQIGLVTVNPINLKTLNS